MKGEKPPRRVVPLRHDAAIGRVARAWGHLEHSTDIALWELLGTEHQLGACVTAQIGSIHPKLKAIGALVKLRGGEKSLIKRVDDFQGSLHTLGDERARVVHDTRVRNDKYQVFRFQTSASTKAIIFGAQLETIEDLENIIDRIHRRVKTFEALRQDIRDALLTPGKRPLVTLVHIDELPQKREDKPKP